MKKKTVLFLLISLVCCMATAQQTEVRYLSGHGPEDAAKWDFWCSAGMKSDKWSKIDVPSCWEQQGFGGYTYGPIFTREGGFVLNGHSRKMKDVYLHHYLGPLGAAVNKAALARQLHMMKNMGCDAIRTSHNPPSQWQMQLCDSLGLMVMCEAFDMWVTPTGLPARCRDYAPPAGPVSPDCPHKTGYLRHKTQSIIAAETIRQCV